jgi:phosphate transport system permease protein
MVIPFSASIGQEVISLVPADLKEAAYSLGATKYEDNKKDYYTLCAFRHDCRDPSCSWEGIGETMAVTMLIGNSNFIPQSIFSPANTMASVIANEFAEATGITLLPL